MDEETPFLKKKKMQHRLFLSLVVILLSIPHNNLLGQGDALFRLLGPEETHIHFNNPITDTREANILIYEAFYDGGGIAIGDVNRDGLQDIYLTGNQVEDKLYLNTGDLQFKDITKSAGIIQRGAWSTGVTMVDVNNDGWLDIYVCKSLYDEDPQLRVNELYINNGLSYPQSSQKVSVAVPGEAGVSFTEAGAEYGLNDFWRSMQATFLDYDRDGDQDMFLVNQPPNPGMFSPLAGQDWLDTLFSCRLLENKEGHFEDVSTKAGIKKRGYGLSATTGDFNRDGWTDIYVCNDYDSPDFLYINQGDGTFDNVVNQAMGHISYFSMGSDVGDVNNDGWLDIISLDMVAEDNYRLKANMGGMEPEQFWNIVNAGGHRQYMFNALQLNQGLGPEGKLYFSDIAQLAGISNTDWSWAPLLADFDNDGFKDLFVTNGIKKDLRNTDATQKVESYLQELIERYVKEHPNEGEVNIWDIIDLETILDMIPSEKLSNYMFRNTNGLQFEQVMTDWGLDQKTFSSGAAYGDLDNDGDLELVVNNVDDPVYIYENLSNTQAAHNFLRVQLLDQHGAPSCFGAQVEIFYGNGKHQLGELSNARGFYSSSEAIIHFGLGDIREVDSLNVYWLGGEVNQLREVRANQTLVIQAGNSFPTEKKSSLAPLFSPVSEDMGIDFKHTENPYDDFQKEVLLPHQMSNLGPALAKGDVNGDGLEDIFVGGAKGQPGNLFLQQEGGTFERSPSPVWEKDATYEDVGAVFFDADNDQDLDMYVVSGGNEATAGHAYYQDRLYINLGKGNFEDQGGALPAVLSSGSLAVAKDYDADGDIDLFVGGRQVPQAWPSAPDSYLLQNTFSETGRLGFQDVTDEQAPMLRRLGMVTGMVWTDYDKDGDADMMLTGIWMAPVFLTYQAGSFTREDLPSLSDKTGWWYTLKAYDIDQDGDEDYLLGNLGLNYKYKASMEAPFSVHYDDFDGNGKRDIVLSYYNFGEQYPLRGRSCSSQQMPILKERFPSYHQFASASLSELYGIQHLAQALHYEANTFASTLVENKGAGGFVFHPLPLEAQFSSINGAVFRDFDADGKVDIVVAGNLYGSEVETPRNDASMGLFLKGEGSFEFDPIPMEKSGLCLPMEVKQLELLQRKGKDALLAVPNNDRVQLISVGNP